MGLISFGFGQGKNCSILYRLYCKVYTSYELSIQYEHSVHLCRKDSFKSTIKSANCSWWIRSPSLFDKTGWSQYIPQLSINSWSPWLQLRIFSKSRIVVFSQKSPYNVSDFKLELPSTNRCINDKGFSSKFNTRMRLSRFGFPSWQFKISFKHFSNFAGSLTLSASISSFFNVVRRCNGPYQGLTDTMPVLMTHKLWVMVNN